MLADFGRLGSWSLGLMVLLCSSVLDRQDLAGVVECRHNSGVAPLVGMRGTIMFVNEPCLDHVLDEVRMQVVILGELERLDEGESLAVCCVFQCLEHCEDFRDCFLLHNFGVFIG